MIRSRAAELVNNFDKHLLVVGDVMLDRFVFGNVNRFSPEAPACPVLDFESETKMLGGAGNVATNLVALGARAVHITGIVGLDIDGQELQWLVQQSEINDLLIATNRPTTTKTRYVADGRHLLRLDHEITEPVKDREIRILVSKIRQWAHVDGIILQDYAKGTITPSLIRSLIELANAHNTPVFVDPKSAHWQHFKGAALVKPNLTEAMSAFGISGKEHESSIEVWGRSMLQYTRAKAVVVTRGRDGMSLFTDDEEVWVLPQPVDVVDVSGAGDTSMATLVLSRLAGASWVESLELANVAAGIVVGKSGTCTVTKDALLNRFPKEKNDA